MGLSRQEVNLLRLLAKCELMCKSKQKDDDRMPKYVESLEDMYQEVKKTSDPNYEFLLVYQGRIAAIKAELGITTSKYPPENDTELLRKSPSLQCVRHRNVPETSDLNQVLNFHEGLQQKITDDMLILTKNLKEQSELANKIIKKDTKVVSFLLCTSLQKLCGRLIIIINKKILLQNVR
ncbi:vesicle transport protein USE1-like isoform X1 [Tribolium madens]|uniref:vesicle transport protein USE1-like isoform X1 n=1 Tax=Tribolium madens TaxID=41895 RepID=UPI001CF74609|nr:vesicle transport protein USE1-like isoform X1 [Tribolium madens]